MEYIQIELKQADGSYVTKTKRQSELTHDINFWTKLEVTQVTENSEWT